MNLFLEIQNILTRKFPEFPKYVLQRDDVGSIINPRNLVQLAEEEGSMIPTIGIVVDF